MKVRKGFVTNSSSTSYTLIVNNKKPKGTYNLIDLIMMYQIGNKLTEITSDGTLKFNGTADKDYFEAWTIDNYILNTESKIKFYKEDIDEVQKEIDKLIEISLLSDEIIILTSKAETVERAREELRWDLTNKNTKLKKKQNELEKLKDNCRILKEYKNKSSDYIVIFTDIDHWGSEKIKQAIEDTGAIVLKKEVS